MTYSLVEIGRLCLGHGNGWLKFLIFGWSYTVSLTVEFDLSEFINNIGLEHSALP